MKLKMKLHMLSLFLLICCLIRENNCSPTFLERIMSILSKRSADVNQDAIVINPTALSGSKTNEIFYDAVDCSDNTDEVFHDAHNVLIKDSCDSCTNSEEEKFKVLERITSMEKWYAGPVVSKISQPNSQNTVEIKETLDNIEALEIYIAYGRSKDLDGLVCQKMKPFSTRIYGDALCKHAIKKIYPSEVITERVKCDRNLIIQDTIFADGKAKTVWKVINMAKCVYGKNRYFHLANGPKDEFYYVVDYQNAFDLVPGVVGKVTACLNLKINEDSDFETITVHETLDPIAADDVFDVYGTIQQYIKFQEDLICGPINPDGFSDVKDEDICEKAIKTEYFGNSAGEKEIINQRTVCGEIRIRRRLDDIQGVQKESQPFTVMRCSYRWKGGDMYNFILLDGPIIRYYYIIGYRTKTVRALLKIA